MGLNAVRSTVANENDAQTSLSKTIAILSVLLAIFVVGSIYLLVDSSFADYESKLRIVVSTSVFVYFWLLFVLYKREGRIGYFWVLLLISYPFFFGQQILHVFEISTTRTMISIDQLSNQTILDASFSVIYSVLIISFGYLLIRNNIFTHRSNRDAFAIGLDGEALRKACICLLVVLAIPTIIYLGSNISLSGTIGYGARIDPNNASHGFDNIAGILAQLMPYVLLGLLITKKRGEKWQLLCLIVYYVLYMLSGSRSAVFSALPVLAYLWSSVFTTKSPRSQMATIFVAFLCIGVLFSFVSLARAYATSIVISDIGQMLSENNVVVDIFQEAGQTFVVTGALMERVPLYISQTNGITYWAGILYVLPNGITGYYYASIPSVDELVSPYLTSYGGVGSSFIAEGYLNFGPWCLLVILIFGLLIGGLANAADKGLRKGDLMILFIVASCFLAFSFFIRSDVRTFPRTFVWDILPILIIQQIIFGRLEQRKISKASARGVSLGLAAVSERHYSNDVSIKLSNNYARIARRGDCIDDG